MSSLKVRAQQQLSLDISKPFKGFEVSFVMIPNLGNWTPKNTQEMVDLSQMYITLRDKSKNFNVFRMPFINLYLHLASQDTDKQLLCFVPRFSSANLPLAQPASSSFPMNLELGFTYDSDFELIVETKGTFKIGYESSSYVSITPTWSTDPCTVYPIFNDMSLSMLNVDSNLGNGVNHITVIPRLQTSADVPICPLSTADNTFTSFIDSIEESGSFREGYYQFISRFAISSVEVSEQYDSPDITTLTASFIDNEQFKIGAIFGKTGANPVSLRPMAFKPIVQILHSGELLTNCRVSIEQTLPNQAGMLVYSNMVNNTDYLQSQDKSDFIAKQTFGNLKNL